MRSPFPLSNLLGPVLLASLFLGLLPRADGSAQKYFKNRDRQLLMFRAAQELSRGPLFPTHLMQKLGSTHQAMLRVLREHPDVFRKDKANKKKYTLTLTGVALAKKLDDYEVMVRIIDSEKVNKKLDEEESLRMIDGEKVKK